MRDNLKLPVLAELSSIAASGAAADIDAIMELFHIDSCIVTIKLADFALGTVSSTEGIRRITHYLFNGTEIQRNYAALYFKRCRKFALLSKAVSQGLISREHAFSK